LHLPHKFFVAVTRLLWKRMGMVDSFYRRVDEPVEKARMKDVAATEKCPWRGGLLQGQVHDDNCWTMGGYAGHAGAFTTLPDLLLFGRRLLNGFLSSKIQKAVWTRAPLPVGCTRTLGWDTPTGEQSTLGPGYSPRSVGHLESVGRLADEAPFRRPILPKARRDGREAVRTSGR
jgi:CubicO group peptidase (beta-lactamase class C family)